MRAILLSGFGRFGSYRANLTELVANQLHGQEISGFHVNSIVFECLIPQIGCNRGQALLEYARNTNSCAVVCLGMASEKTGLCLETATHNKIQSKYCSEEMNGTPINPDLGYDANITLETCPWNVGAFISECKRQNVSIMPPSTDAGGFCCNHLMFQLAMLQRSGLLRIPFVFLHVPCSPEAVTDQETHRGSGKILMPTEEVVKGIGILLKSASLPVGFDSSSRSPR